MESYHSDISKIHSAGNAFAMQRYSDIKPLPESCSKWRRTLCLYSRSQKRINSHRNSLSYKIMGPQLNIHKTL